MLAEGLDRLGHAGLDLLLVGHVHGDADGALLGPPSSAAAASAPAWFRSAMATLAPSRTKGAGDLLADAAGGAGDDGDLVLETHDARSPVQRR